jgi:hypothetical protein
VIGLKRRVPSHAPRDERHQVVVRDGRVAEPRSVRERKRGDRSKLYCRSLLALKDLPDVLDECLGKLRERDHVGVTARAAGRRVMTARRRNVPARSVSATGQRFRLCLLRCVPQLRSQPKSDTRSRRPSV